MLVKQRRVKRIKGGSLASTISSGLSKIGSFFKNVFTSNTAKKIIDGVKSAAKTDIGKTVLSAGKDVAIAGVNRGKDILVEKLKTKQPAPAMNEKPIQALKPLTVVDPPKVAIANVIKPPTVIDDTYGFGLKRTPKVRNILKSIKGKGLVKIN